MTDDAAGTTTEAVGLPRDSWLIQRLDKRVGPPGTVLGFKGNPFSFGGGLMNGGLKDEAMELLGPLLSFHYMGAAEFEFGAVPKALGRLADTMLTKQLSATEFTVKLKDVEPAWDDRVKGRRGKASWPPIDGEATVYLLCWRAWAADAEARIRTWAGGDESGLKAITGLANTLRPSKDWHGETVGWLELDNGFMFFTDREMFEGFRTLFDVDEARA